MIGLCPLLNALDKVNAFMFMNMAQSYNPHTWNITRGATNNTSYINNILDKHEVSSGMYVFQNNKSVFSQFNRNIGCNRFNKLSPQSNVHHEGNHIDSHSHGHASNNGNFFLQDESHFLTR